MLELNSRSIASFAFGLLFVLSAAPGSMAQDSLEEAPANNNTKESQDLMKQSQMSVKELIKADIIPDDANISDTGPYKPPKQEDMDREAKEAQEGRQRPPELNGSPYSLQSPYPMQTQNALEWGPLNGSLAPGKTQAPAAGAQGQNSQPGQNAAQAQSVPQRSIARQLLNLPPAASKTPAAQETVPQAAPVSKPNLDEF